ncbi:MAG: DNA mismatch repair endonuclease MutL [Lachnospiraceae bacterium]|nr:DNA mismatch repair endonuclease MutL [Lachnospiraceae bacterium]
MAKINVLDNQTIDKIAAGEVVERPASVIKELVENAIDSGANAITVEIKEGGISFIRVTDNGSGIEKSEIRNAFLRHATSKIMSANDLTELVSLGFRGEALASIAAVSMVEAISKVPEDLTGIRYVIEGGVEKEMEEIGAPEGTTILVRNLFYNTLPRKKFLKSPQTEGSYVADLMEHLAMSHPQISFHFIMNNNSKFHTSGNDDLKEIIYRIYGKDIVKEIEEIHVEKDGITVDGYLGKPIINRSNRNYEIFYINGRFIKSSLISKAVEDGYKEYLMQHKFPFCILHFSIDTKRIDVNVHPTKMEVRIANGQEFYELVQDIIYNALHKQEMIPEVELSAEQTKGQKPTQKPQLAPEPFEKKRMELESQLVNEPVSYEVKTEPVVQPVIRPIMQPTQSEPVEAPVTESVPKPEQLNLFDDKLLSAKAREQYEIIGQLFDTYWLISYQDKLMIVDQHAAHEKVKYERFIKQFREHNIVSQNLNPPVVITLNGREKECLMQYQDYFASLGFGIEEFGGNDYAISSVPMDLYGYKDAELFYELLDELADETISSRTPDSIHTKIATMACKAAVKGNMRLSRPEVEALIDELLSLENPYNCPHGRPTIISMSKYELEKKFKRIVT